jgi:hypothetical protein
MEAGHFVLSAPFRTVGVGNQQFRQRPTMTAIKSIVCGQTVSHYEATGHLSGVMVSRTV